MFFSDMITEKLKVYHGEKIYVWLEFKLILNCKYPKSTNKQPWLYVMSMVEFALVVIIIGSLPQPNEKIAPLYLLFRDLTCRQVNSKCHWFTNNDCERISKVN